MEAAGMGVQRQSGLLESIDLTPGKAHGYVRVGGSLLHVPMINRGVLQEDGSISRCQNGERYNPLPTPSSVALDIDIGPEGRPPFIVAWAPK